MAKFDAGKAIERMEFDFTEFGGRQGYIPEPTTEQVQTFMGEMRSIAAEARELQASLSKIESKEATGEDISAEDVSEALSQMNDDTIKHFNDRMAKAIAGLCGDFPSEEDYSNLPYRVKGAFIAWLTEQIRPEAQRPVTRR